MLDTVRPWDSLTRDEQRRSPAWPRCSPATSRTTTTSSAGCSTTSRSPARSTTRSSSWSPTTAAAARADPNGSFNEWRFFNGVPTPPRRPCPTSTSSAPRRRTTTTTPAGRGRRHAVPVLEAVGRRRRWGGRHVHRLWPAQMPRAAETRHQYIHAVDVVPTDLRTARHRPPEVIKGFPQSPIEGESFAAALTDAERARQGDAVLHDARSTFDLPRRLAGRDGPPAALGWGHFEHDEWELFRLETDRAQSTTSPSDEPERLESLKDLWFYYAGYNGLPLDDRAAIGAGARRATTRRPQRPVRLLPGLRRRTGVGRTAIAGPLLHDRRRSEVDSADAQGVIWAAGGVAGGHSLYVKDGRLRYMFNWVGDAPETSRRARPVAGRHVLTAEFAADRAEQRPEHARRIGTLTLYVDDQRGRLRERSSPNPATSA